MSVAADILTRAKARGTMIATAESCTGGMVAAALTDTPGSSAMFERGFVTYTNAAKTEMLGVLAATLDTYGAVSEEVAAQMSTGALSHSHAQLAVSITGIAGPGGSEFKPEGRVCFGLASSGSGGSGGSGGQVTTETIDYGPLGRDKVRRAACDHALHLLHTALSAE
jgi:nicotinamide-nucleotide amidase